MADPIDKLYVGPAGWSYPDWEGIVYPTRHPSRFKPLEYIAQYFDCVEVNSSFYRIPDPRTVRNWVSVVRGMERFRFTAKLWQRFTHERGTHFTAEEVKAFRGAIDPLADAGRLAAVLLQFPWSFKNGEDEREWLGDLAKAFGDYPLVVEVRHTSWDHEEMRAWMRDRRLNWCNIDQPALKQCLGPSAHATGPVGYVRFHGRNEANWFAQEGRDARYDYYYSDKELEGWVGRITTLLQEAQNAYVIANNHFRGQGPANALQLRAKLTKGPVLVPDPLRKAFPDLEAIAKAPPGQRELF